MFLDYDNILNKKGNNDNEDIYILHNNGESIFVYGLHEE